MEDYPSTGISHHLPSIINQFIISLKDTSLISVIGPRELTQNGKIIAANSSTRGYGNLDCCSVILSGGMHDPFQSSKTGREEGVIWKVRLA